MKQKPDGKVRGAEAFLEMSPRRRRNAEWAPFPPATHRVPKKAEAPVTPRVLKPPDQPVC